MEENKVAQITKHTDSSRSTDSGVSGNAQTGAREIRKPSRLVWEAYQSLLARDAKYSDPNNLEWEWDESIPKFERHAINAAVDLRDALAECSRLASRVEELENLIAKHSGCSRCADSASGITSTNDSSEIRRN